MLLSSCLGLMVTNKKISYDEVDLIVFKLCSGVDTKRFRNIHSALLLLEVLRTNNDEALFNQYIDWLHSNFKLPVSMAIIKYAIADRKLTMHKVKQTSPLSWKTIFGSFKTILLNKPVTSDDMKTDSQYQRYYAKLKCMKPVSEQMYDYVVSELG